MLYQILQLDFPVIDIEMTSQGCVESVKAIHDRARLPVWGCDVDDEDALLKALNGWWTARSIPESRTNLMDFLRAADVETATALAVKCYGVSLSDQYWIKPVGSDLSWDDVNVFTHDFAPLSMESIVSDGERISTADSSLNGELVKYWKIDGGSRKLYKESTRPYYQQAYNEVFASRLLEKMEIPHVTYELSMQEDIPYSTCPAFTSEEIEYVPAVAILGVRQQWNHESNYTHFLKCAETLAIPITAGEVDTMLAFDYLINNSDRHYGNFGFLRNSRTLAFLGMAPLFDHGNSMWNFDSNYDIRLFKQPSKPFRAIHEKQIQLVKDARLPLDRLTDDWIREEIETIYASNPRIDAARLGLLQDRVCALKYKLEMVGSSR